MSSSRKSRVLLLLSCRVFSPWISDTRRAAAVALLLQQEELSDAALLKDFIDYIPLGRVNTTCLDTVHPAGPSGCYTAPNWFFVVRATPDIFKTDIL